MSVYSIRIHNAPHTKSDDKLHIHIIKMNHRGEDSCNVNTDKKVEICNREPKQTDLKLN